MTLRREQEARDSASFLRRGWKPLSLMLASLTLVYGVSSGLDRLASSSIFESTQVASYSQPAPASDLEAPVVPRIPRPIEFNYGGVKLVYTPDGKIIRESDGVQIVVGGEKRFSPAEALALALSGKGLEKTLSGEDFEVCDAFNEFRKQYGNLKAQVPGMKSIRIDDLLNRCNKD